jgi:hypothetical protein
MNDYAMGAIVESRRARIRIQIRTEPGQRDEILIVVSYSIIELPDGTFVLSYHKGLDSQKTTRRTFPSGTYIETKLMG